ncbi:cupin domain-containing protein [Deinococcus cavernae]|uniref:Cupin domain-containing protein n=1 Tax=Deinococcus cavernae TaxID=2320857 RepID=A0A418VAY9_9DEIO|nr:cupin domain-containing protein [Deinococcus cavernae]RJF73182.1 cupin domain-containing protein [Deinococcus cavernae]
MNIHRQHHQTPHTTPNATVTPLATPGSGATQTSVIRQRMAPDHANPTHTHTHEEIMVVLSGTVSVTVGEDTSELSSGDTLIVPASTPHSVRNQSSAAAEWLIISPAASQIHGPDGQLMTPAWAR